MQQQHSPSVNKERDREGKGLGRWGAPQKRAELPRILKPSAHNYTSHKPLTSETDGVFGF